MDDQVYYLKSFGLIAIALHYYNPQEVFESMEHGKLVFLFALPDANQ